MEWDHKYPDKDFYHNLLSMGADVQKVPNVEFFTFYIDAFSELSTARQSGMGISRIPFTAIHDYARIYDVEDFQEFIYVIRIMDNTVMSLNDKKTKPKENDASIGNEVDNIKNQGRRRQGSQGSI